MIAGTLGISLYLRSQIFKLPAHKSMLDVAEVIFQTCKTYLIQQGKFLLMLFAIIARLRKLNPAARLLTTHRNEATAERLFAKNGYHAVTIRQIAQEADDHQHQRPGHLRSDESQDDDPRQRDHSDHGAGPVELADPPVAVNDRLHLLRELDWARDSITGLILVTQSPDYFLPSSSCLVHKWLGLSDECAAFDVGLGCSGYPYGLYLAASMLKSGGQQRILVLHGETPSQFQRRYGRSAPRIPGCYVFMWGLAERSSATQEKHELDATP